VVIRRGGVVRGDGDDDGYDVDDEGGGGVGG
nr:hypothetical protein [Tanacetum cinerariifolium]